MNLYENIKLQEDVAYEYDYLKRMCFLFAMTSVLSLFKSFRANAKLNMVSETLRRATPDLFLDVHMGNTSVTSGHADARYHNSFTRSLNEYLYLGCKDPEEEPLKLDVWDYRSPTRDASHCFEASPVGSWK